MFVERKPIFSEWSKMGRYEQNSRNRTHACKAPDKSSQCVKYISNIVIEPLDLCKEGVKN
jgi:hypothetical protein